MNKKQKKEDVESTNNESDHTVPIAQKIISSDQNPSEGGRPKFIPINSAKMRIRGDASPLLKPSKKERECEASYTEDAKEKRRGEIRECESNIEHAAQAPSSVPTRAPRVTIPICTIEEKATQPFKSQQRKQMTAQIRDPVRDKYTKIEKRE